MACSMRKVILSIGTVFLFASALYYLFQPYAHVTNAQIVSEGGVSLPNEAEIDIFTEEWKEYRPVIGSFSVFLPTLPQHASEVVPIPNSPAAIKYNMYLTQSKSGVTYMINLIEYPPTFDMTNSDVLLEGVIKELMSGDTQNVLVDKKKDQFNGYPSVDFALKTQHGSVSARAFIADKTIYVLTAIDTDGAKAKKGFQRLLEGFSLKESHT